jgi:very-short-patch-repair endonuclease
MRKGQKLGAARKLRSSQTDAERRLWLILRAKRFEGVKFKRQVPIGPFVADFACIQQRIVIELDGSQHAESETDARRDAYLVREGWRIIRFWNSDLTGNREGVLTIIAQAVGRL